MGQSPFGHLRMATIHAPEIEPAQPAVRLAALLQQRLSEAHDGGQRSGTAAAERRMCVWGAASSVARSCAPPSTPIRYPAPALSPASRSRRVSPTTATR